VDGGLIFIAALFVLFWLLVIRPQRRRSRQQDEMHASLRVGDEVVTAGGLYGEITALRDDEVRVEIADGIEVRIARRAIAGVTTEDLEDDDEELAEEEPAEEEAGPEPAAESEPESASTEGKRR
jgi:preprotein translocase subunit YajC